MSEEVSEDAKSDAFLQGGEGVARDPEKVVENLCEGVLFSCERYFRNISQQISTVQNEQLGLLGKVQQENIFLSRIENLETVQAVFSKLPTYTGKMLMLKNKMGQVRNRIDKMKVVMRKISLKYEFSWVEEEAAEAEEEERRATSRGKGLASDPA
eukprot:Sdes_comp17780_c0_seq1m7041